MGHRFDHVDRTHQVQDWQSWPTDKFQSYDNSECCRPIALQSWHSAKIMSLSFKLKWVSVGSGIVEIRKSINVAGIYFALRWNDIQDKAWTCACVCVRVFGCVCVKSIWEWVRVCIWYVYGTIAMWERANECTCECSSVCVCVCVCFREQERDGLCYEEITFRFCWSLGNWF